MLEIHLPSVDASNGNIPLSWCLDKVLLDKLESKNIKDPAIVICITPEDASDRRREYRKVVRVKDLMCYVELLFAGKNKLHAFVPMTEYNEAEELYQSMSGRSWKTNILNYYRTELIDIDEDTHAESALFDVPDEIFSKEPPGWEKKWVNWLHSSGPIDQCSYRRRRIFAYTIQPALFIINYFIKFIATIIAFLYGSKTLSTLPLRRPLTFGIVDTVDLIFGDSYFVGEGPISAKKLRLIPFMPLVLIPTVACFFSKPFMVIVIAFYFVTAIIAYFEWKSQKLKSSPPWYTNEDEKSLVICTGDMRTKTINDIPDSHKTLRVRYEAVKAKVCRPYSQ